MGVSRGICYVAYGLAAQRQIPLCRKALQSAGMDYPVTVIDEAAFPRRDRGGRWAKLNLDTLSPYQHTLYLDADTRVRADISVGFAILADGWDVALAPSSAQDERLLHHVSAEERKHTFEQLQNSFPLQLQGGVFWFAKNERTAALFATWRDEWERYEDQDQAALLRALDRAQVKIWLLSNQFNGGALVNHYFGQAR